MKKRVRPQRPLSPIPHTINFPFCCDWVTCRLMAPIALKALALLLVLFCVYVDVSIFHVFARQTRGKRWWMIAICANSFPAVIRKWAEKLHLCKVDAICAMPQDWRNEWKTLQSLRRRRESGRLSIKRSELGTSDFIAKSAFRKKWDLLVLSYPIW